MICYYWVAENIRQRLSWEFDEERSVDTKRLNCICEKANEKIDEYITLCNYDFDSNAKEISIYSNYLYRKWIKLWESKGGKLPPSIPNLKGKLNMCENYRYFWKVNSEFEFDFIKKKDRDRFIAQANEQIIIYIEAENLDMENDFKQILDFSYSLYGDWEKACYESPSGIAELPVEFKKLTKVQLERRIKAALWFIASSYRKRWHISAIYSQNEPIGISSHSCDCGEEMPQFPKNSKLIYNYKGEESNLYCKISKDRNVLYHNLIESVVPEVIEKI